MKRLGHEIADQLSIVASARDDIWVLDGDLGDSYGLYDDANQPRYQNFVQVGIAEQTMVAAAAGLAAVGKRPWVFSFSAFLCNRAADQIRTCVAQTRLPVVLVGSHAGAATGSNGSSHAALGDIGLINALGEIEVWAPADSNDVVDLVQQLTKYPRPAYIRASREPCPLLPLPAGQHRSNRIPGDVVLLSTGLGSQWTNEVVEVLAKKGVKVPWSHIARIGDDLLDECFAELPRMRVAVVIEDHAARGGLADAVRRRAPRSLHIESIAWPCGWQSESGQLADLRQAYRLDTPTIVQRIEQLVIDFS
jgi:transketolase